jgi:hypothetical protein
MNGHKFNRDPSTQSSAERRTPSRRRARPACPNAPAPPGTAVVDAAGHCLTAFFIPGLETDAAAAERVYHDLRAHTETRSGHVAHKRRIFQVACRRRGADRTITVGDSEATDGETVVAIFQLGRDAYAIHCGEVDAPAMTQIALSRRAVYAVTDFD